MTGFGTFLASALLWGFGSFTSVDASLGYNHLHNEGNRVGAYSGLVPRYSLHLDARGDVGPFTIGVRPEIYWMDDYADVRAEDGWLQPDARFITLQWHVRYPHEGTRGWYAKVEGIDRTYLRAYPHLRSAGEVRGLIGYHWRAK